VPRDPSKPPKQPRAINIHKLLKSLEADDYVELDEDCDVDVEKTLRKMVKALKSDKPIAEPVLDRLKKDKRMAGLKPSIDERIEAAQKANEALADEDEEPEDVDEFIDVLLPICVEAANASTVRAKQHQTIQDLRVKVEQLEEELDRMKELLPQKKANVDPRVFEDDGDVITHVDDGPIVVIQKTNIVATKPSSNQPPPAAPSFDLTYGGY
jgi:predicted nuclease with TOPRIM domain